MAEEDSKPPAGGKKDKNHKWIVIGGVGTLVTVYYLSTRGSSSSTATTTATTPTVVPTTSNPTTYVPQGSSSGYNTGAGFQHLSNQISQIQAEIAGLTPPSGTGSPTATSNSTYTNESLYTSPVTHQQVGYWNPTAPNAPVVGVNGGTYQHVGSGQEAAVKASNVQQYWQQSPGNFIPGTPAGAPFYIKTG